jgi:hypothetical protein
MIANLIGGFVSVLIGVSLTGPIAEQINTVTQSINSTGAACTSSTQGGSANCQLYLASGWGATVLKLVPGFFALAILGIGLAVTYASLRQAGVL